MDTIQQLMERYWSFLRDNTAINKIAGTEAIEITTPFLDRHNDYIQIYVIYENNLMKLTDGSNTITDLEFSGFKLNSPRKKEILDEILNAHGIGLNQDEIYAKIDPNNFAQKKHDLIQTIIAVNDMFYLSREHIKSWFFEDFCLWLDENEIRYIKNYKLSGKSEVDHKFDVCIPKSKKANERILKLINNPNMNNIKMANYSFIDVREAKRDFDAIVVMNDTLVESTLPQPEFNFGDERKQNSSINTALTAYQITPYYFSQKDSFKERLAA